jgi:hypothetical protein
MFERQNRLSQTIYYKVISHFISNSNHGLNAKLKQYFLIKMSKPNDKLRKIPVIFQFKSYLAIELISF